MHFETKKYIMSEDIYFKCEGQFCKNKKTKIMTEWLTIKPKQSLQKNFISIDTIMKLKT